MILTPLNDDVVKVNNMVLDVFPGEVIEYFSFDAIPPGKVDNESLYPSKFLDTIDDAIMWLHELQLKIGCIFPVRLAFAMMINKSQGQTLDMVGLYLPNPIFTHSQLCIAFSRTWLGPIGIMFCDVDANRPM
ncbi:uncharacterized protein LOC144710317 [Wolffia australiana]